MKTTDQVRKAPNPTGKGGFGDNPQNRNPGGWKKEDTPRFKLEQMMKLSEQELKDICMDLEAPMFERKLANAIVNGQWKEIEAMINQVYGMPKQPSDITTKGESINPYVNLTTEELRKLAGK